MNVLVAASRSDRPHDPVAKRWLEHAVGAAAGDGSLTFMPIVLASFLRLVTSPKIFRVPTPINDAVHFIDTLLSMPGARLATLGAEWPHLRQLCLDKQLGGNDLPDAGLSAATIQLGEHLVSFDRDLGKLLKRSQLTLLEPADR